MVNPMALPDRVVLVTGASSGIGRDTAVLLSCLGARVVLAGRDRERLTQTLSGLTGEGHCAEPFDLRSVEQIPQWIQEIGKKVGPLAGLVHCAGVHSRRPLKVLNSANFEDVQRINVTAALMLAKGLQQKGCCAANASVVLLSSVTGLVGEALAGIRALARTEARIRSMHEHGHESTGTN